MSQDVEAETNTASRCADLNLEPSLRRLPVGALLLGLVVGAEVLEERGGPIGDVVHEGLAVALHVAFRLLEGQASDVAQRLQVVLGRTSRPP